MCRIYLYTLCVSHPCPTPCLNEVLRFWLEASHPFLSGCCLYTCFSYVLLVSYKLGTILIPNHWEQNVHELGQSLCPTSIQLFTLASPYDQPMRPWQKFNQGNCSHILVAVSPNTECSSEFLYPWIFKLALCDVSETKSLSLLPYMGTHGGSASSAL